MRNRVRVGIAAALVTELLYGCSFVFTKSATSLTDPVSLLAWRFVLALLVLLALWAVRIIRVSVSRATVRPLLVLSAFQPLAYYLGETFGIQLTTASEGGLLLSAIPVTNLIAAALLLGTRPSGRQVAGISVTLLGVLATVLSSAVSVGWNVVGYLLLLLAVVSYSLYSVFAERYAEISDVDKTVVMVACGAAVFVSLALVQHARAGTAVELVTLPLTHPALAGSLLYLALGSTIGAFFLQNVAIASLGATRYSTFIGVSTLAALVSAALALGEKLTVVQLVGGAAIMAGVYLANRRSSSDAAPDPHQPSP